MLPIRLGLRAFGPHDVLQLPHGIARLVKDERHILLRPQYHLFSLRFRTAWPLKATIEWQADGERTRLLCTKRIPWSSAILTLIWFLLVGPGTVTFLVSYAAQGGFTSLSGIAMGIGIAGLGALVFAFGMFIVALAYRLEDHRLMDTYAELRAVLVGLNSAGAADPSHPDDRSRARH